jgi:hypothetical protein
VTTQRAKEFQAFIDGRNRLNEQLDRLRADVDRWLDQNDDDNEPSIGDIAKLAGLLETRRNLLTELAQLDDNFVKFLLQLRAAHRE